MKFIQGHNRQQTHLFPVSLDASIDPDNEVRIIDLFVDSLDIHQFGFKMDFIDNGRPAYHPFDMLKLFIYGYLNKIRSSRDLEKECKRNIEVIWLMKSLAPDHNTISNFRRDNPLAIKKVFRETVRIAKHFNLIGGKLIAGDSTKLRAQNSKKNNFNIKKIELHVNYIDNKIEQYNKELENADEDKRKLIVNEIEKQSARKVKYNKLQKELEDTGEVQISTSDPDSRQLITRNNITEVAYNVQTTVDAKNYIPIDYKVTNENDSKALGNMARRAKSILQKNDFTLLYDKGYHTGSELKTAQQLGIETIVAIPAVSSSSMAPDPAYNVSEFIFDETTNTYRCPQNNLLITNGNWYKKTRSSKKRKRGTTILVQHYKTSACKTCPVINLCTKNTRGRGRVIERSEYSPYIEINRKNVNEKEHLYKRRQAIVEHPYGIIKRQWGFSYIMTKKGMKRASADVGLIFVAYNLRRLFSILGKVVLKSYLGKLLLFFYTYLASIKAFSASLLKNLLFSPLHSFNFQISSNRLYLPQNGRINGGY
jgi:transposase